ncbi:MAG TPA: type II toxin-antitoxin system prevent-host-death family antitoxin [Gemmatimonadaceae bacterium]|nr:type II toxin-antitoxin system prevent-host-death family antitoxin [Gemmatimonadaceae bacterium]
MKKASISYAKAHLSALLKRVREGQTVLITDRGRTVARLEPVATVDWDAQLRSLIEDGIVAPPSNPSGKDWFRKLPPPIRLPPGVSVVEALLAEREEGW